MAWTDFKVGDAVRCAQCLRKGTIELARLYNGKPGFVLSCGHRNGYRERCDALAIDSGWEEDHIFLKCSDCELRRTMPKGA